MDWNNFIKIKTAKKFFEEFNIEKVEIREEFDGTWTFGIFNKDNYGFMFRVEKDKIKKDF